MSQQEIIHAYRHLLRHSLRAIQFSKPARYTLRDRLRLAFRKSEPSSFNQQRITNTIEFLQHATTSNGLEHKIVKNLLFVWWDQARGGHNKMRPRTLSKEQLEIKTTAFDTFNWNINMLNESMGLCLPAQTVREPN